MGFILGGILGVIKGDTRSLDYGSAVEVIAFNFAYPWLAGNEERKED